MIGLGAILFVVGACGSESEVRCGEGTRRVGNTCQVLVPDAGALPDAESENQVDANHNQDASVDGGQLDASLVTPCSVADTMESSRPGEIVCDELTCTGKDICAFELGTPQCKPSSLVTVADVVRECDEAADCLSGVCCVTWVAAGNWYGFASTCETACALGPGQQICTQDDECGEGYECNGYRTHNGCDEGACDTISLCAPPIGC